MHLASSLLIASMRGSSEAPQRSGANPVDELFIFLDLELLVANAARSETLHGRDYLVRDAIILREGVLNGSDGPLYYPLDEIGKDVGTWNGMPLTAPHPMALDPSDGKLKPVSARSPMIANKYQIGLVFNDRMEGSERKVEVWFDILISNRIDSRIIPRVKSGEPINVSTGVFTKKEKMTVNSHYKGKTYTHVVRNIKPDHLAVLLDDKGACSVSDGCGINLPKPIQGVTMNEKNELVTWLTVNCDCWKAAGSDVVLNGFDLDRLKALKAQTESAKAAPLMKSIITSLASSVGFKDSDPAKLPTFVVNSLGEKDKKIKEVEDAAKVKPMNNSDTPPTLTREMVLNALKGMNEKEVLDLFPTLNETVETAKGVVEKERIAIMQKLVANAKSDEEKKAKLLKLKDKSLPQLNELLEFATLNSSTTPPSSKTADEVFLANFFGAQGGNNDLPANGGNRTKDAPKDNRPLLPSLNMYNGGDVEVVEDVA